MPHVLFSLMTRHDYGCDEQETQARSDAHCMAICVHPFLPIAHCNRRRVSNGASLLIQCKRNVEGETKESGEQLLSKQTETIRGLSFDEGTSRMVILPADEVVVTLVRERGRLCALRAHTLLYRRAYSRVYPRLGVSMKHSVLVRSFPPPIPSTTRRLGLWAAKA